ncbi:hypothetical protein ACFL6H_03575, partial [Candidatus Latescibacterota bacterium]
KNDNFLLTYNNNAMLSTQVIIFYPILKYPKTHPLNSTLFLMIGGNECVYSLSLKTGNPNYMKPVIQEAIDRYIKWKEVVFVDVDPIDLV